MKTHTSKLKLGQNIFDFTDAAEVESFRNSREFRRLVAQIRTEAVASMDSEREIQRRIVSLERWRPMTNQEREDVSRVAEATLQDELTWLQFSADWLRKALASAQAARVPPTLTTRGRSSRDIFDFTD